MKISLDKIRTSLFLIIFCFLLQNKTISSKLVNINDARLLLRVIQYLPPINISIPAYIIEFGGETSINSFVLNEVCSRFKQFPANSTSRIDQYEFLLCGNIDASFGSDDEQTEISLLIRGAYFWQESDTERAIDDWRKAELGDYFYQMHLFSIGNKLENVDWLSIALEVDKSNSTYLWQKILTLIEDNPQQSLSRINELLTETNPEPYLRYMAIGMRAYLNNKPRKATEAFTSARQVASTSMEEGEATTWLGRTLLYLEEDYYSALNVMEEAIVITQNKWVFLELALAAEKVGNSDLAISVLKEALQKFPQDRLIRKCLARQYWLSGELEKVNEILSIGIDHDGLPGDPNSNAGDDISGCSFP